MLLCSWRKVYEGYDMWGEDKVAPDFRNCSISYHGPTAGLTKLFHWSMPCIHWHRICLPLNVSQPAQGNRHSCSIQRLWRFAISALCKFGSYQEGVPSMEISVNSPSAE